MQVHTALDTNGYYGDKLSDAELETIDLVLLDIKTWNAERHKHLTGMDVAPTLDFARRLSARRRPMWIRFVLVPGLTDDPADLAGIARFASELETVERLDVLAVHQLGKYKWKQLGMEYTLRDVEPPSAEAVGRAVAIFTDAGLKAY